MFKLICSFIYLLQYFNAYEGVTLFEMQNKLVPTTNLFEINKDKLNKIFFIQCFMKRIK